MPPRRPGRSAAAKGRNVTTNTVLTTGSPTTTATATSRATTRRVSAAALTDAEAPTVVRLRRLEEARLQVQIEGETALIPHNWSEKARGLMRGKQSGTIIRPKREPKNPEQEAYDSCYWLPDGRVGMPATAFKAAMVDACRHFEGLAMKYAKLLFVVEGEGPEQLVVIAGAHETADQGWKSCIWEATPRNQTGVVDLRYRLRILPWRATLTVRFIASRIDADSVIALVDAAGRGGVGDWRPSSPKSNTGVYGMWRVASTMANEEDA